MKLPPLHVLTSLPDTGSNFTTKKLTVARLLALGVSLFASLSVFAEIPQPIQTALLQANVSPNDVSLLITPVNHLSYNINSASNDNNNQHTTSVLAPILYDTIEKINAPKNITAKKADATKDTSVSATVAIKPKPDTINVATSLSAYPLRKPVRHNASVPRTPASTMKLIPTFIALDLLGKNFTWFTHAYHTGLVTRDTLYGDLIIKGSGDPKLTHRRLNMLLAQVSRHGIRHIKGNIILDASIFQNVRKNPALFDNEPLRPYNASPDGLLVNFNSIEMTAIPMQRQSAAKVYYTPQLADYDLPTQVSVRGGRCRSVRKSLAPRWQDNRLLFNKALPYYCGGRTLYIAHPDAKVFAANVTKQKWFELGNTLSGEVISTEHPKQTRFGTYVNMTPIYYSTKLIANNTDNKAEMSTTLTPSSPLPLVSYPSLPLSRQIYDINHYSNNVMTEQLLLSLPFYKQLRKSQDNSKNNTISSESTKQTLIPQRTAPPVASVGSLNLPPSSYPQALTTIEAWWRSNLTTPAPNLTNGSGLCRTCYLSAENLSELLEYAYHHPSFTTYATSLGVAGYSGTIKGHRRRLPQSAAIGHAFIKTGTLDNVTAMAGYVQGASGQDYIVVGIINTTHKLNTTKARYALDTMLDWTAKH